MLEISFGEHGPRVVLLQILLNRKGNILAVDGAFGPKTKAAVVDFQKTIPGVDPNGHVQPSTFNPLFRDSNLSIVDVVDVGDPMLQQREAEQLRAAGSVPIELGLMCNGVGQMVSDVIQRAGSSPIALLRMTGHGNLGRWMTVSVGSVAHLPQPEYDIIAAEYYSYISPAHFSELKSLLSQLTRCFASFGSMEHLGCSIGSRPESRKLMQGLASLWNVPISAGIRTQVSVLHFDGPSHTEYPRRQTLSGWSTPFRNQSL